MKKSCVLLVFLTILFCILNFGQEGRGNGRVVGYIVDEEGKPIPNVKVTMESTHYQFKLETLSDKKGKWVLIGFGKDVYKFTFSKQGYQTLVSEVALSGINRNPEQRLVMKKLSGKKLLYPISSDDKEKLEKAYQLFKDENYPEALKLFEEFVNKYPSIAIAHYNLAIIYSKLKKYDSAIFEFEKALKLFKEKEDKPKIKEKLAKIYTSMAEIYMDQEKYEEAANNYKLAMEIVPPKDHAVAYNVAEIMFKSGKVDEAIKYYKLAIQLNEEEGIYYLKLGYAYLNKGNFPSAIENFEKFLELSPNDPQAESIRKLIDTLKKKNSLSP